MDYANSFNHLAHSGGFILNHYSGWFPREKFPDYRCPYCKNGILSLKELTPIESNQSKSCHEELAWEPGWIEGVFSSVFLCNHIGCEEPVVCIGKYKAVLVEDLEAEPPVQEKEDLFFPMYFQPTVPFFPLVPEVPAKIRAALEISFSLYYASPSSAANMARIALEDTLTFLNVKVYRSRKGKRTPILLNERLSLLPIKYEKEKHLFQAIRWLGNAGSHDLLKIDHEDVEICFHIFERLLEKIFIKKGDQIDRLAHTIVKRRGPKTKRITKTKLNF